jgi:hypothetical protein
MPGWSTLGWHHPIRAMTGQPHSVWLPSSIPGQEVDMSRAFVIVARSVMLSGALVLGLVSSAMADRAFSPRFSTNANGDIAVVGNTLETCQDSAANCANARKGAGSALNNNGFVMERVDIDPRCLIHRRLG